MTFQIFLANQTTQDHSGLSILGQSFLAGTLSSLTAGITNKIKIPGFTGRGSISQVARQINTKFYNGTIKRITAKTFGKMAVYEMGYSVFDTIIGGVWDAFETNRSETWRRLTSVVTIPLFS